MPSSNRDATNGKDPRGDQGIPSACVWSAPLGGMWTLHTLVRHSHISSSRSKRSVPENEYPFDDHDSVFKRLFACANVPFLSTLVPDRGKSSPHQSMADQHEYTNHESPANELHLSLATWACCPPLCEDLLHHSPVIRQ